MPGLPLFGASYSVYLTVVSLTILESACPYCLTSLGLMLATQSLVVVQRPVETAHRSWLGLVGGRGVLAAWVILLLHQLRRSAARARRAGRRDPCAGRALTEAGALFGVLVSTYPGTKLLFGASASAFRPSNAAPLDPIPAGAVVQQGRRAELSNVGHQRPGLRGQVLSLANLPRYRGFQAGRLSTGQGAALGPLPFAAAAADSAFEVCEDRQNDPGTGRADNRHPQWTDGRCDTVAAVSRCWRLL